MEIVEKTKPSAPKRMVFVIWFAQDFKQTFPAILGQYHSPDFQFRLNFLPWVEL
jgi:hypothetical protein